MRPATLEEIQELMLKPFCEERPPYPLCNGCEIDCWSISGINELYPSLPRIWFNVGLPAYGIAYLCNEIMVIAEFDDIPKMHALANQGIWPPFNL